MRGIAKKSTNIAPFVRNFGKKFLTVANVLMPLPLEVSCPIFRRTESYDTAVKILGQLHLNRPSDQLSPRTPQRTLLREAWSPRRVQSATAALIAKTRFC